MQPLPDFAYHAPETLADAAALRNRLGESAAYYAGGTELLLALRHRVLQFEHLIDVKALAELRVLDRSDDGEVVVGAALPYAAIRRAPVVREHVPWLVDVLDHVGNVRVRSTGTLGGNLCFAEPHSDPATLLTVLGARLVCDDGSAERQVAMADFQVGAFETVLRPGELLKEIRVPSWPGLRVGYAKLQLVERPMLNVAVALMGDEAAIRWGRVAVGCIGGRPVRSEEVDDLLAGDTRTLDERLARAAAILAEAANPLDDEEGSAEYKRHAVGVLLARAGARALDGGPTVALFG